jgi:HdeA/HdeB family
MKFLAAITLAICLVPCMCRSAELNLATLTCGKYENEVLPAAATNPTADSINTVMWLFGYSVAKSGARVLYSDGLSPFGFALDNECKSNPAESMLEALAIVKPETKNPMDLANVDCGSFASKHAEFARSDTDSATTIMMWLFGFSVARSGSHIFDADSLQSFAAALLADCAKHPDKSLFDTLTALKMPKTVKASTPTQ